MKAKYYGYVIAITLFLTVISLLEERAEGEREGIDTLIRGEPGSGEQEVSLELEIPELEENMTYRFSLNEREYTREEREELFASAKQEIDELFPRQGETTEHITGRVYLPDAVQNGLVQVEWEPDTKGVIETDGSIIEENVEKTGTLTEVTAELSYMEYQCRYRFPVCVYPAERTGIEAVKKALDDYLKENQEKEAEQKELVLPDYLLGYQLNWSKENSHTPILILGMGGVILFLLPWYARERENKKRQERKQKIESEYPRMLSEFTLLLGSGMTIRAVWKKLSDTYERQKKEGRRKQSELYEEISCVSRLIEEGGGEVNAYEGFAKRCELPCCKRFSMLLIQHLQKGNGGLAEALEREESQAFEERKNMAKRQGEEAGTKLLFPMLLMLGVVVAVMLIPACMTMEG